MNAWQCFVCRGARGWRAGALSRVVAQRSALDRVPASRTLFLLETLPVGIHLRTARIFLTQFTEKTLHYLLQRKVASEKH